MILTNPKIWYLEELADEGFFINWQDEKNPGNKRLGSIKIGDLKYYHLYKNKNKIGTNLSIYSKNQEEIFGDIETFFLGYNQINPSKLNSVINVIKYKSKHHFMHSPKKLFQGNQKEDYLELEKTGTVLTIQPGYSLI